MRAKTCDRANVQGTPDTRTEALLADESKETDLLCGTEHCYRLGCPACPTIRTYHHLKAVHRVMHELYRMVRHAELTAEQNVSVEIFQV